MHNLDRDDPYEIAYNEAVRALQQQEAAVDGFRSRAGIMISAAAITTSFLGSNALEANRLDPTGWLAIAAFMGTVGFALAVIWPIPFQFSAGSGNLIATYIESLGPSSKSEIHRDLALHMGNSYSENAARMDQLVRWFQAAGLLLALEVLLWVASYVPWA